MYVIHIYWLHRTKLDAKYISIKCTHCNRLSLKYAEIAPFHMCSMHTYSTRKYYWCTQNANYFWCTIKLWIYSIFLLLLSFSYHSSSYSCRSFMLSKVISKVTENYLLLLLRARKSDNYRYNCDSWKNYNFRESNQ